MPVEYMNWVAAVHCNDCGANSEEGFHIMGQRCDGRDGCGSFNTRRVGIQKRPPTAEQRQQVRRLAANRRTPDQKANLLEAQCMLVSLRHSGGMG